MQAWRHLQMWAIRGLSGARNTQLRYPTVGALGRQFSFATSRSGSVQIRSAGTTALPLQRRYLHEETKPLHPPCTFAELENWTNYVLRNENSFTGQPTCTMYTGSQAAPLMVDARKSQRTLTWPADPFDQVNYALNTTAYFYAAPQQTNPTTYKFYTAAFQQYASPTPWRYVLAVTEQKNGPTTVQFVNEQTPINSPNVYTKFILAVYQPKAPGPGVSVSMNIVNSAGKSVYLSPNNGVVTASSTPAGFNIFFMLPNLK